MNEKNVEPHFLVRVRFRAQVLHRQGLCRVETTEFQNYVQVMFRPIIRADRNYVERQYTIFITLCDFRAFYVKDKCVESTSVSWSKSYLQLIFSTVKTQVLRYYTNFVTYRKSSFQTNDYNVWIQIECLQTYFITCSA